MIGKDKLVIALPFEQYWQTFNYFPLFFILLHSSKKLLRSVKENKETVNICHSLGHRT